MNILGICIGEQCAASLTINGKIVGASQEERFVKKKSYSGFPYKSINYLLKINNLTKKDVDEVYVINKLVTGLEFSLVQRFHSFSVNDYIFEAHKYYYPILFEQKKIKLLKLFKNKIVRKTFPNEVVNTLIKTGENNENTQLLRKKIIYNFFKKKLKVHFVNHHFCHALYAYISNPNKFKKSLIFTADSLGDNENNNVYYADNKSIKCIYSDNTLNLGRLFRNITLLLGLKPYQHEYKLMGLAPYAKEEEVKKVKNIFQKYLYKFDKKWIFKFRPKDHYFTFKKLLEGYRFDNIAGGLQRHFEEKMLEWINYFLNKKYKIDTIMFSGGLAMNIKLNQKIDELCKRKKIKFFAAPSADDYSHALSLPFFHFAKSDEKIKKIYLNTNLKNKISNLDLGYKFSSKDKLNLKKWAKKNKWKILNLNYSTLARLLANQKIFALCHGRSEFGARALGFRSIIADPLNFQIIKKINISVKKRDFWMPFAPAILDTHYKKYLELKNKDNHYFMASGSNVTNLGKKIMSAAVHPYDLTARPQIVTKDKNELFYNIIKNFGKLTDRYVLLNTSLNLHGFPIVNDNSDLKYILKNSLLDGCILDDKIILRS